MENDDDKDGDDIVATNTLVDFLIIYDDKMINFTSHETNWLIDNGVSTHATSWKDFFTSYRSSYFKTIKMGNDGLVKVTSIVAMYLEIGKGSRLVLKDVKHILDIHLNLIFAGKLDDDGYGNFLSNGQWKLTRGAMVAARGKKVYTLYIFQAKLSSNMVNAMEDYGTVD